MRDLKLSILDLPSPLLDSEPSQGGSKHSILDFSMADCGVLWGGGRTLARRVENNFGIRDLFLEGAERPLRILDRL